MAKIVDKPAFINISTPKLLWRFGEYCSVEVMKKVCQILQGLVRPDFVFDTYKSDNTKGKQVKNRDRHSNIC